MHAPSERQSLGEEKASCACGESDSARNAGQPGQKRGAQGTVGHDGEIKPARLERLRKTPGSENPGVSSALIVFERLVDPGRGTENLRRIRTGKHGEPAIRQELFDLSRGRERERCVAQKGGLKDKDI